ncbi:AsnC family transcriptional regulator [Clostridium frigoris]|uniref:siroheme decarboxylase n=1 Tax=Clostridium frigoris TaxID=205327 RepID=A0ABS6BYE5_9CLOT|nr:AsnC family transcriptional regulator [Clostridium frigoris]MBU3161605.1 AsnC family transcriptional regulator [Clostridium frigoris]
MLSGLDKSIIRAVQEDLPLVPEPYKEMARELGITENALINRIKEFCSSGIIRRFGTIVNHRNIGFTSNAMVVWIVPKDLIEDVSKIMISFPQVSHCYQRPTFPQWPYNVFTMIHGQNNQECEKIVKEIVAAININDYELLYSSIELKKESMKYFIEE